MRRNAVKKRVAVTRLPLLGVLLFLVAVLAGCQSSERHFLKRYIKTMNAFSSRAERAKNQKETAAAIKFFNKKVTPLLEEMQKRYAKKPKAFDRLLEKDSRLQKKLQRSTVRMSNALMKMYGRSTAHGMVSFLQGMFSGSGMPGSSGELGKALTDLLRVGTSKLKKSDAPGTAPSPDEKKMVALLDRKVAACQQKIAAGDLASAELVLVDIAWRPGSASDERRDQRLVKYYRSKRDVLQKIIDKRRPGARLEVPDIKMPPMPKMKMPEMKMPALPKMKAPEFPKP